MAKPVITYKASNYVTTAGPTFTAAPTWTPAANSLLVALVVGCSASPTDPTGVTGHGQTYSKVVLPTATLSTTHIMSVWVANAGASPTSVAEVASFGGTPTGNAIICFEITGWEDSEQAINAFGTNIDTGTAATGTTGTVNLSLRPDVTSEHVNLSFWLHLANEATNPRTNWTETVGADGNFNNPATGAEAQFRTDVFELTNTATWTTSINWRGLGLVVRGTSTTPEEKVTVSDQISVSLTPIFTSLTENVEVTDGPITFPLEASIQETVKVDDSGQGATQLVGPIKVQDGPVVAALETPSNDLSASLTEDLKVSESPSTTLNPLERSLSESIRVTDTTALTLNPLETSKAESVKVSDSAGTTLDPLETVISESVKVLDGSGSFAELSHDELIHVTDVVAVTLNPLEPSRTENVKVSDQVTAQIALSDVSKTENIKVQDTATVLLNPEEAQRTENIRVSDQLSVLLNPLNASPQEAVKVSDSPTVSVEISRTITAESVRVTDTVSAQLATLVPDVAPESVKVSDTVQASLASLVIAANLTESVRVQDSLTVGFDTLRANLTESVKVSDSAAGAVGPPTIEVVTIHVRPRITNIHVRPPGTTIHVRPRITTIRVREP